jgi:hypothetical protein
MARAAGMMQDLSRMGRGMMRGTAGSSPFWKWGGRGIGGAAYAGPGTSPVPVWIDATTAIA